MSFTNELPKYALFAIIGVILVALLQEWVTFSKEYDQQLLAQQKARGAMQPALLSDTNPSDESVAASNTTSLINEDFDLNNQIVDTPPTLDQFPAADIDESMSAVSQSSRHIVVTTDTLRVTIDKLGGDIVEVALRKHLTSIDEGAEPMLLLEQNSVRTYIAQSGLFGPNGTNVKSAMAVYHSAQTSYDMVDQQTLDVDLVFRDPNDITVIKRFTFHPNDYLIDVNYLVNNQSQEAWQATFYSRIVRDSSIDPGADSAALGMQSYLGAATSTEDTPYKKVSFKDIEKEPFRNQQTGGWVAMLQHYFVSAWIPNQQQQYVFYSKKNKNGLNVIGFSSAPLRINAGDSASIGAQFYAGPKDQYRLKELAPHLDLTVDYGWLWWIAQPLYALLYLFATGELHMFGQVYDVFSGFGNWGFAIIMLTVVVKALFFRLSAASYRSMANMRRVQPKLLALRERYANDKQAQSKAMMELYQKEKINPLGGCLPILIQMPVFIALYWALMESVELRHEPFIGWIKDLSVMDPYFVLPIIMGATMWFQQKMNPPPPDPMQAKVMQWMPIIFTFFFLWFPSGLVIYWVSNNVLSIAQQWVITRQIENAHKAS